MELRGQIHSHPSKEGYITNPLAKSNRSSLLLFTSSRVLLPLDMISSDLIMPEISDHGLSDCLHFLLKQSAQLL